MSWLLRLPEILELAFAFAFGAVVGSFLNVVIYRLPRGESVVTPRSRCPSCGNLIRWYDNIPVVSWFVLRGRCRDCRAAIAVRYPLVETINGALWVLAAHRFGVGLDGLAAAAFLSAMVALFAIDLEHYILPDVITLPGIVAGLALSFFVRWTDPVSSLVGAVGGAGILLLVMGAYWLWRRVEGMGWGDVKMLAMVGAFLGWRGALVTVLLGAFLGAIVGLSLVAVGWAGERAIEEGEGEGFGLALPFGTCLALGASVALVVGDDLFRAYLELTGLSGV